MTIIGKAGRAMRTAHKTLDPTEITISRGSASAVVSRATVGETRSDELRQDGVVLLVRYRNFLIDADDYDFGDGCVEPVRDDEIVWNGVRFLVTEDSTDSVWRWSDRERTYYRVNTVEVER